MDMFTFSIIALPVGVASVYVCNKIHILYTECFYNRECDQLYDNLMNDDIDTQISTPTHSDLF